MTTGSISLRIDLAGGRIGPGKIALLERIIRFGSISAAGRSLGMSYRRAWRLVNEMNPLFGRPLVDTQHGGKAGGGARLSELGLLVAERYRAAEEAAAEATRGDLDALAAALDRVPGIHAREVEPPTPR